MEQERKRQSEGGGIVERLTLRDDDGRALLTPYGLRIYCSTQATADCICKLEEALQAQEPRVMTLGEVKVLPDCVFLEDRDISNVHSIKTISRPALPQLVFVNTNSEESIGFRGPDGDTSLVTSRYGAEWRCWTSRPDEKRRAETPWQQ